MPTPSASPIIVPTTSDVAAGANTLLLYKCDEASGNLANSGTASSSTLTATGTPLYRVVGNRYYAIATPGSARDGFAGATTAETGTTTLTVAAWVRADSMNGGQANMFAKLYAPAAWTAPFISAGMDLNTTADGQWNVYVCTSATLRTVTVGATNARDRITINRWYLLGLTYDGTTLKAYKDDRLVGSGAFSGTIDWGTHGAWNLQSYTLAGVPSNGLAFCGAIRYARVENEVKALSWFQDTYRNGVGSSLIA